MIQESLEDREFRIRGLIDKMKTSDLEIQRENYVAMVDEVLDSEHRRFLHTLLMLEHELGVRRARI